MLRIKKKKNPRSELDPWLKSAMNQRSNVN